jgi:hypothetical protein
MKLVQISNRIPTGKEISDSCYDDNNKQQEQQQEEQQTMHSHQVLLLCATVGKVVIWCSWSGNRSLLASHDMYSCTPSRLKLASKFSSLETLGFKALLAESQTESLPGLAGLFSQSSIV